MTTTLARLVTLLAFICATAPALAAERVYEVLYKVKFLPERKGAQVTLVLKQPKSYAREFRFSIDPKRQKDFAGDGEVSEDGESIVWRPPERGGELRWFAKVESRRGDDAYDGYVAEQWAVFRGDDLVPPAALRKLKRARSDSRLRFELPKGWSSITPYPRGDDEIYEVAHEDRGFDRPTGWMALGRLGVVWGAATGTRIAVAGPVDVGVRHQDILAFLRLTLPAGHSIFPQFPARLLVVSAGDPMWRGGLSGPNSIYLHADRPLISENGTSTLLHELMHVVMGLHAERGSDWMVEAFAELYSLEILQRSGAISRHRYRVALEKLAEWGKGVDDLFTRSSDGARTARGVLVLKAVDEEIRARTDGAHSLDDIARDLARLHEASFTDLRARAERIAGGPLKALASNNVPGAPSEKSDGTQPRSSSSR
jgi:hypothetical protein